MSARKGLGPVLYLHQELLAIVHNMRSSTAAKWNERPLKTHGDIKMRPMCTDVETGLALIWRASCQQFAAGAESAASHIELCREIEDTVARPAYAPASADSRLVTPFTQLSSLNLMCRLRSTALQPWSSGGQVLPPSSPRHIPATPSVTAGCRNVPGCSRVSSCGRMSWCLYFTLALTQRAVCAAAGCSRQQL